MMADVQCDAAACGDDDRHLSLVADKLVDLSNKRTKKMERESACGDHSSNIEESP